MKKILTLTLLLIPVLTACAQGAMRNSADVVDAHPVPVEITASAGERVDFVVKLDIAKTWHLYAHEDSMFIGVDLVPDESFPLQKFDAKYPKGHEGEFFGEKVVMVSGKETISASATVPKGMKAGVHELLLSVTVQACDDKTCLAPADLPIRLKLTVE